MCPICGICVLMSSLAIHGFHLRPSDEVRREAESMPTRTGEFLPETRSSLNLHRNHWSSAAPRATRGARHRRQRPIGRATNRPPSDRAGSKRARIAANRFLLFSFHLPPRQELPRALAVQFTAITTAPLAQITQSALKPRALGPSPILPQ